MAVQKGKQGAKGQKQIVSENLETLKFYRNMALISCTVYLTAVYFFYDFLTFKQIFLISLSFVTYFGCYTTMNKMAKAQYNETGQLIDSGLDLNMEGGFAEHLKDLIILTAGCQVLASVSLYFWFLWLLAPGRMFWMLWVNFLQPYFFQNVPGVSEEVNEKKQKKLERRMKRQQGR